MPQASSAFFILLACAGCVRAPAARGEPQAGAGARRLHEHLKIPPGIKYELGEPTLVGRGTTRLRFDIATERVRPRLANNSQTEADGGGVSDAAVRRRCAGARGTWCGEYLRQQRVPTRPVPRGSSACPNACSGWGNCNHDTGRCECPAGRGGPDCGLEVKRPCTHRHRRPDELNGTMPMSHINPDGSDIDVRASGWLASRCFGHCWDDVAACFCGEGSNFSRIPAPPGSPPWTPPLRWGRPLADGCQPSRDRDDHLTFVAHKGGTTKYEQIYGPDGWCNKQDSETRCCHLEMAWPCDGSTPMETTCANQCAGHGECFFGFCRCHADWYGQDCSRKKAGSDMEPGMHEAGGPRPWLASVTVTPPAALNVPALPTRPRPLIYVYDVPPEYTARMLQYRLIAHTCLWRRWYDNNVTATNPWTYGVESLLHELMLQSEHRTFDPEEADFFYVPIYITCYFWPILGWADAPWWHAPLQVHRPMHGANMISEVLGWLQGFPWWARRGGRDHIWLMAADEGACWMPTAAYNASIVLTHWGRTGMDHTSNSAYLQDNYNYPVPDLYKDWPGVDYQERIKGHPCYDPRKDLVIPAFKEPGHFAHSPLLGGPPLERDVLLFFRGDTGAFRLDHYSRGIRQALVNLSIHHDWFGRYRIVLASGDMAPGDYSQQLARSKFCLVAPGDGWSPRAEDAILHGCIPLVIMNGVHAVFESVLDWRAFSLRVRESALEAVPRILQRVSPERLARMQRRLAAVWHRFAYASGPLLRSRIKDRYRIQRDRRGGFAPPELPPDHPFRPLPRFPSWDDDAFGTIMQWLYHRIPDTR